MEKLNNLVRRGISFFDQTLWMLRSDQYSRPVWVLIRLVRTLVLAVRGFGRHHGALRASALTFFTLFSLVPVAAIAFGVAQGFGMERHLHQQLLEYFSAQETVVRQIIDFAQNMLDNTRGGMVAGVGVLALFWAVIKVLGNIESAFNHIWGVPSRPPIRKLTDYLAITLICPLLLIISGSLTVFITSHVTAISGRLNLQAMTDPLIYGMLKLLPFFLVWTLFTLVYMIMPNTRVHVGGALLAGILTGTLCQLIQTFYIYFQILMSKYNAIYGSFAALPLFLLWMQISWTIVLAGAEIAYGFQHSKHVDPIVSGKTMSIRQTFLLCLVVCRHVVKRFHAGAPAPSPEQMAGELGFSIPLVDYLSDLLVRAKVLVWVENERGTTKGIQPSRNTDLLTLGHVIGALEDVGETFLSLNQLPAVTAMTDTAEKIRETLLQSSANRPLVDLP